MCYLLRCDFHLSIIFCFVRLMWDYAKTASAVVVVNLKLPNVKDLINARGVYLIQGRGQRGGV